MAAQSTLKNMVLCLGIICLVSSAVLAGVYALTKEPIAAAAAAKTNNAITQVVPAYDGEPEAASIEAGGQQYDYYIVKKDGEVAGYAITASATGFGGPVTVMVGVTADGTVYNTSVLSQSETPGLGAKCTEPEFADQFKNLDPASVKLAVTKDGGDIDAITASTITSRAYVGAVNNALAVYRAIVEGSTPDVSTGATVPAADGQDAEECQTQQSK
ncbi:MAG: RnfABCDGE type electron transport complex subunit G [Bacteroidetes bacterium]|uniref:Ion-translocating oxidoreductase complex subunit G n=1 Tax=Candidatus Cryptobacteroides excrementavium TaxID=2840759 RepID=A0A9D9J293_9BACT|nr:RnfABCDGE type electron transport complex subunit G [Candidatus Cryptobacteroides excrementavium]